MFAWKAPELPLDDLATRLRPGVQLADLCAGSGREAVCLTTVVSGLRQGEHLVVMSDLDPADPALAATVDELNTLARAPEGPKVWLLTAATPEQLAAFYWTMGPGVPGGARPRGRCSARSTAACRAPSG